MPNSAVKDILSGIETLLSPMKASNGGYVKTIKTFDGATSERIIEALEPNPPAIVICWGGDNVSENLDDTGSLFRIENYIDLYMYSHDERGGNVRITGAGSEKGLSYLSWDVLCRLKGQKITGLTGCQPAKSGYIDISGEGKLLEPEEKSLVILTRRIKVDTRILI